MSRTLTSIAILIAALTLPSTAHAETYEINPGDDLWARLGSLAAGDEVIVHAGTYPQTSRFETTWAGTAEMPIVVRGADGEARPVLTRDGNQNLINLHGSYFTFRGFELTGGSHGIRMGGVDHATLEDLVIHGTGDVGLSCNLDGMDCSFMTIRRNEIYDTNGTGEGMYLGCNNGACAFRDSIIELNYVHDLGGSQGDGIEIKTGSWSNVIRDNVVIDSNYPGITLYTFDAGEGRMPNVIERNLVISASDNGIQVTGRAIVRNNIVIGSGASGIASQPNMGMPTEVVIVHNTVIGAGDSCLRANSWDTGTGFVVANNALYCEGARAMRFASAHTAMVVGNVGLGTVEGATGGFTMGGSLAADVGTESAMGRVYPPSGSTLIDAADPAHDVADDFDLRPRGAMADVGAYERNASGMPFWLAVPDFKELESPVIPGTDGGVVMPGSDGGVVTPGSDGGVVTPGTDGGGVARDGGSTEPSPDAGGSCSCRVGSARSSILAPLFAIAVGLALVMRRRRRCPRGFARSAPETRV